MLMLLHVCEESASFWMEDQKKIPEKVEEEKEEVQGERGVAV